MSLRPLFKWFGSKWSASKHYPAPAYDRVFEPFAGGAGYSLRHHTKQVWLYDSNPNLQVLWQWLIEDATETMIRDIPLGVAEGTDIRTLGLNVGQALLLKHWQRTNNVGSCWTISPWGNKPGQWTPNTRSRVAEEVHGVKHWVFRLCPADVAEATYFVDPPYEFNYRYGCGAFDYEDLARVLRAIPTPRQLLVCEASCPKTGKMPTWFPFEPFRKTVTSRRRAENHHHSNELFCHMNETREKA